MNWEKISKIVSNSLGGLTYGLMPLLGKPNINYAVTDADEFTLGTIALVSYGISDVTKNRNKYVSEYFSGLGSGGFGLLGYDISFSLSETLLSSKQKAK